jgi:hypothetical protein
VDVDDSIPQKLAMAVMGENSWSFTHQQRTVGRMCIFSAKVSWWLLEVKVTCLSLASSWARPLTTAGKTKSIDTVTDESDLITVEKLETHWNNADPREFADYWIGESISHANCECLSECSACEHPEFRRITQCSSIRPGRIWQIAKLMIGL